MSTLQRFIKYTPAIRTPRTDLDAKQLAQLSPVYHEITDTGTINSLWTIRHGLGRTPRGVRIVQAILAASGDVSFHRLDTDPDWTDVNLYIRFRPANSRVLLEVF